MPSGLISSSRKKEWRWWVYALISLVVSLIPLYGYHLRFFDHHPQSLVFWLILAWGTSILNALILLARGLAVARRTPKQSSFYGLVSILISIGLFFGWYAIGNAIAELWAG